MYSSRKVPTSRRSCLNMHVRWRQQFLRYVGDVHIYKTARRYIAENRSCGIDRLDNFTSHTRVLSVNVAVTNAKKNLF